jgi:glutaredoxin
LYGRAGCHLCDDARAALLRLREELPFRLVERDIEDEEALLRAYFERIPVIVIDGQEVCEYFLDEDRFRQELAGAAREPL